MNPNNSAPERELPFRCLIVEDDRAFAQMLGDVVTGEGGRPAFAATLREARERLAASDYDIIVVDNHLPDGKGFGLYSELARARPGQTVIAITGLPDVATAVELTRQGLFDYLCKPFTDEQFAECLRRAAARLATSEDAAGNVEFIAVSPAMRVVQQALLQAARHPGATVLLTGETGSGKDVAARALHRMTCGEDGNSAPFVAFNCASVPAEMFEGELFGSERGAYTGSVKTREGLVGAANKGTLFFDEIAEVPLALQAKLLRFLESGEYRPLGSSESRFFTGRVVAATNKSLRAEAAKGNFREDLLYRLDVVRIEVPPLRERREEIPALARSLLEQIGRKYQRKAPEVRLADLDALAHYSFPGNVRELRNLLERSLLRTPVDVQWLALDHVWLAETPGKEAAPAPVRSTAEASGIPHQLSRMEANEYELIRNALIAANGGIRRAAESLGISHQLILRRFQKWPELRQIGRKQE